LEISLVYVNLDSIWITYLAIVHAFMDLSFMMMCSAWLIDRKGDNHET